VSAHLAPASASLSSALVVAGVLLALVLGLAGLRWRLLHSRQVTEAETWGCGYAAPTARMQYTASSFSQPLTDLFRPPLQTPKDEPVLTEYFPSEATLTTNTLEPWRENFYGPVFRGVARGLARLRWLQHGRVQLYVLYIALTILSLLVWYLGGA